MSKKEEKQKHAKSNYDGQEHESLRLGHQAATRENVKDVVEDKNCHAKAKAARFEITSEPSKAPKTK
jgi:hypothetical protein